MFSLKLVLKAKGVRKPAPSKHPGLAVANLKYTTNFVDTFYPTNNTFSLSEDKAGYAIGGGVEWRFAPHWLLRGEYLYLSFESINSTGTQNRRRKPSRH
jgi:opacity protein-like surface antigen